MSKVSYIIEKAKRAPKYAADVIAKKRGDYLVNNQKFTKVSYSPADMFFLQVKDDELKRPDMIVRHLAIDNYYGNNDFGFAFYSKLQDARVKKGYSEGAVKRFYALIESYAANGYDPDSYIIADKNLALRDGSHRMAMALYLNLPEITVAVYNSTTALVLDYNWLLQNGFSADEVQLLRTKADGLRKEFNKPLKCIVWNNRQFAVEKVCDALNRYGVVLGCENITLNSRQLEAMKEVYDECSVNNDCTVIDFQLDQPLYEKLKFAQQPVFKQTVAVKKDLGELADVASVPNNFRENAKITEILKQK